MKPMSFAKRAAVLAVLAGSAVGANAANYDLATITAGEAPTSFNAFHGGTGLVSFDDNFMFTLLTPGITGGSVLEFSIPGIIGAKFTGAELYSGTVGSGSLMATAIGTPESLSFSGIFTPAGSYYFHVAGAIDGVSVGAAYSGAISVAAAPVPEPESYAMFLAGLGVMGAIAVRRNKAKKG